MRLKCVACEVLARAVYHCAATSPHVVDLVLLRRGLHNTPGVLRDRLQAEVDATGTEYDAVVMAYGLCGGATAGLAAQSIPVVVPRAHDCITVFLGSRERYQAEFTAHPGTYWYVPDYIERDDGTGEPLLGAGASTDDELKALYAGYVERFGRENADYLMEVMGAWRSHYNRAAFIDIGIGDAAHVETRAQAEAEAERRKWEFERIAGQLTLVHRLLDGDWEHDFLVLNPGEQLVMSYDDEVVRAVRAA